MSRQSALKKEPPMWGSSPKGRAYEVVNKAITDADTLKSLATDLAKYVVEHCQKRLLKDRKFLSITVHEAMNDTEIINKLIDDLYKGNGDLKDDCGINHEAVLNNVVRTPNFQNALKTALREELE